MKLSKYAIPFAIAGLVASGPLYAQSNQDESQSGGSQQSMGGGQGMSNEPGQGGSQQSQAGSQGQTGSEQNQASNQPTSPGNQVASAQDVRKIQNYLQQQGYQVQPDGIWGPKTSNAVKQFQQANNLQPTGQLDPNTLQAMNIQLSGQQRAPASQGQNQGSQGQGNLGNGSSSNMGSSGSSGSQGGAGGFSSGGSSNMQNNNGQSGGSGQNQDQSQGQGSSQ